MEVPLSDRRNHLDQPIGFPVPGWEPPPRPPRQAMSGRFCRIEPLNPADHAADLHEANLLDREHGCWTYLVYGPFATFKAYLAWAQKAAETEDPLFHAIIDLTTGRAVGVAAYMAIHPKVGSIEVGHLNFSPLLRRTLAGTEAMYLMMKRAFELGYRRYEWKCDSLNESSRAAAQRLGFSYEGIFRQARVYKGRNRDTAWYAAIDSEWPALERAFLQWLDRANFDGNGRQRTRLSDLTQPILKCRG